VIDVTVADVPALMRLITYLYAGDYDDGTASSTIEGTGLVSPRGEKGSTSELGTEESAVHRTET
jgi:hypothetical protein